MKKSAQKKIVAHEIEVWLFSKNFLLPTHSCINRKSTTTTTAVATTSYHSIWPEFIPLTWFNIIIADSYLHFTHIKFSVWNLPCAWMIWLRGRVCSFGDCDIEIRRRLHWTYNTFQYMNSLHVWVYSTQRIKLFWDA